MDLLRLKGIRIMALCGALPEEQQRPQPFELDVDISADLAVAGASDELSDTVDYGAVCAEVCEAVQSQRFTLLEAMAHKITQVCMACDERVMSVTVEVRKLRPPVPQPLATSAVCITRSRQ